MLISLSGRKTIYIVFFSQNERCQFHLFYIKNKIKVPLRLKSIISNRIVDIP